MKIKICARDLQNMLKTAKGLQLNKLDIDIQKGLQLNKLDIDIQKGLLIKNDTLIMNNLHTQLESKFYVDVIEPGETLIPEPTLKMIENFKSGSITITENTITHGSKELKYMPGSIEDFYTINDEISYELFTVKESELSHLLEANYATCNDITRPALQGIEIRENKFIALNEYYLSVRQGNFTCNEKILISPGVWKLLLKVLDKKSDNIVKVSWDKDKLVKFEFEDFTVKGNLYKNHLMDVKKIIRDYHSTEITLEANKLIESLKLMDKLTKEEQLILLSFTDNKLEIKTKTDMNIMTDEIEISKMGEDVNIAFNIKYLLAVVNQYKKENVKVELKGPYNSMIFRGENKLDLVLPVRLPEDYGW
mgnify:FL=1|jgi:DNA polymerase-3 subunit beta